MSKINRCLRLTFIIFNGIFVGIGCLLLYGSFKATAFGSQLGVGGSSLIWTWVFSFGVFGLSCLGLVAAKTEKLILFKVFAGFMGVAMIIMLTFGIIVASNRHSIITALSAQSDELQHVVMGDPTMRASLDEIQLEGHCCGLWSPTDWDNDIPDSCDCTFQSNGLEIFGLERSGCEAKPPGSSGPSRIYSRPCSVVIQTVLVLVFRVALGVFFGFATIAFFGLVTSLLIIYQIRRHDQMGGDGIPMKVY